MSVVGEESYCAVVNTQHSKTHQLSPITGLSVVIHPLHGLNYMYLNYHSKTKKNQMHVSGLVFVTPPFNSIKPDTLPYLPFTLSSSLLINTCTFWF